MSRRGRARTVSFLADQLGSSAGGGRFATNLAHALIAEIGRDASGVLLEILRTQGEPVTCLGALPSRVRVKNRRFPSRLRHTVVARAFGMQLPRVDVAYGPFYYSFPQHAKASVITLHDLSFRNAEYHVEGKRLKFYRQVSEVISRCRAVVCGSDSMLEECRAQWPEHADRFVRIYDGAAGLGAEAVPPEALASLERRPFVLAVGTIEPRKNYDRLLDAYEMLLAQHPADAPALVIVGREGWMCDQAIGRIRALELQGNAFWLRNASDQHLAYCYSHAAVFTYLSLYEGFGYPPFEAAYARTPMVLSDRSTVGEIWRGHARCVDPADCAAIIAAWRWAMALKSEERARILDSQLERAKQYNWQRCAQSYLELFNELSLSA